MTGLHKLSEFAVPIPLFCFHCGRKLPKSTPVEVNAPFVIAHCPKCQCMTPFKLEAA
jgi:hypothetical protein